ncbi:hypothetical protein JQ628_07730 [Bradyrhizobium lablabi]|uniref:hypothetical protein n=1 Tax=Bradyrhizobium lablabi TaxID=722472 RepID=UPI001BAADF1C|nr:hypothetical protein [Bradyrhizobium lablabi]MBR1121402.1 hypothetical protein [Bradyrhizobium lablabi]
MPTKDGFDPAHPLPQFLAVQPEQGIGNVFDGAVPASRTFKAGILIATVAAAAIAFLAVGDPVALVAWGTASLVGDSAPPPTPAIQSAADAPAPISSTADAQSLPPATKDAPAREEVAASEPVGKDRTENTEPLSEALFRQFQAWAAEQEAQARAEPVQPVQDAPAQAAQNAPAQSVPAQDVSPQNAPAQEAESARGSNRFVQKRRHARSVHNARAEMRTQNLRRQVRRAQRAHAERPPVQAERPSVQDARAQGTSVQDAQALPFLPMFGLRN